jgi:hypothetical protein
MSSSSADFRYPTPADASRLEQSSSGLLQDSRTQERSEWIHLRREVFRRLNIEYGDLESLSYLYWSSSDLVEPANDRLRALENAGNDDQLFVELDRLRGALRQKLVLSGTPQDAPTRDALEAWLVCRNGLIESVESARRLIRQPPEERQEDLDDVIQAVSDGLSSVVNGLMDVQLNCYQGVAKLLKAIRSDLDRIEGNIEEHDMRSDIPATQDKDVPHPSASLESGGTDNLGDRNRGLAASTQQTFTQTPDFGERAGA